MQSNGRSKLVEIVQHEARELLADWVKQQCATDTLRPDLMNERELREQSQQFLRALGEATQHGSLTDIQGPAWAAVRELLEHISSSRATHGFTSSETATFVFSLKQSLFIRLRRAHGQDVDGLADDIWQATVLLDALGLYSTEVYQKSREGIIARQQQELLELSTPVVQLWDDVLALPLIGTLDSARTQTVMENLLQSIVETGSAIAIIDITGVPLVDTLVAQHLLKTVAAARLMGRRVYHQRYSAADCTDDCAFRGIAGRCDHQGDAGGRLCGGVAADGTTHPEKLGRSDAGCACNTGDGRACGGTHSDFADERRLAGHHPGGHA